MTQRVAPTTELNKQDRSPVACDGYTVRPATEAEFPLIYSDFLKSLHGVAPWSDIPNKTFFPLYHDLLEHALRNHTVLVAEEDTEKVVMGWVIGIPAKDQFCPLVIMYVYAKQHYRGMEIEGNLLHSLLTVGSAQPRGYSVVFLTAYQVKTITEAGLPGRAEYITEACFRNRTQSGSVQGG